MGDDGSRSNSAHSALAGLTEKDLDKLTKIAAGDLGDFLGENGKKGAAFQVVTAPSLLELGQVQKASFQELKSLSKPPVRVIQVMTCVAILLGEAGAEGKDNWKVCQKMMNNPPAFVKRVEGFTVADVTPAKLKKIEKYINDQELDPETVAKSSMACKSVCMWLHGVYEFGSRMKDFDD